ncbi:MAG: SIMPL domain-containing protein [Candidatus Pacebacteria bacterium]|jgi:uncharacterized protein YggE|nr:SIMPL domain-containing protein [Candidatus Paceibacterota bacterium]
MEITTEQKNNLYKAILAFMIILGLFFAVKILSAWSEYRMMGSNDAHTITLTGHGEVQAAPDIATVYFTIEKDAKTTKEAQEAVALIEKKALDVLKNNGIADKDIKTESATVYPKSEYRYNTKIVPCSPEYGCPTLGNTVVVGYTSSLSITVKVRKIDDAGKIMTELGTVGISNISGPNFTLDDEDGAKAEARKEAIEDARTKAEALAKDLGVKLGRVSSYNESGNGYYPMYYAKDSMASGNMVTQSAQIELPKGENTISSDVTITYEIK